MYADANDSLRLDESNLYAGGTLLVRADSTMELSSALPVYVPGRTDVFHPALKQGEMLDQLADHYWGTLVEDADRYWWVIASVNGIDNPLDLAPFVGKALLIPDLIRYKLLAAST